MAAQSFLIIFRRVSVLALSILALISTTGCKERERLTTEIQTIRRETLNLQPELLKAQTELYSINKTYQNLRAHPVVRSTGPENLAKDVQDMTERKNALELEIEELRKDFEQYRKSLDEPIPSR